MMGMLSSSMNMGSYLFKKKSETKTLDQPNASKEQKLPPSLALTAENLDKL